MAKKLSSKQIDEIIAKDRPGFRAVPQTYTSPAMTDGKTSHDSKDLDYLRRKFLGTRGANPTPAQKTAEAVDSREETEIIQISPATDRRGSKSKAAVLSGKAKRIVGEQG